MERLSHSAPVGSCSPYTGRTARAPTLGKLKLEATATIVTDKHGNLLAIHQGASTVSSPENVLTGHWKLESWAPLVSVAD